MVFILILSLTIHVRSWALGKCVILDLGAFIPKIHSLTLSGSSGRVSHSTLVIWTISWPAIHTLPDPNNHIALNCSAKTYVLLVHSFDRAHNHHDDTADRCALAHNNTNIEVDDLDDRKSHSVRFVYDCFLVISNLSSYRDFRLALDCSCGYRQCNHAGWVDLACVVHSRLIVLAATLHSAYWPCVWAAAKKVSCYPLWQRTRYHDVVLGLTWERTSTGPWHPCLVLDGHAPWSGGLGSLEAPWNRLLIGEGHQRAVGQNWPHHSDIGKCLRGPRRRSPWSLRVPALEYSLPPPWRRQWCHQCR